MKMIAETDLFLPVKELLIKNGYSVYSEIEHCDIVGKKNEVIVIVELKKRLNLDLILQAIKRQRLSDTVFIAIPQSKTMKQRRWKDLLLLIKRLGLGLICVHLYHEPYAEVVIEPSLFEIKKSQQLAKRKKEKLLKEVSGRSHDVNIGGSSKQKIMTAYKEASLYIACLLQILGPLSPKKLRSYGSHPKKTNSILYKNFYNWFYRVKTGVYDLTKEGEKVIKEYKNITELQKKEIEMKIKTVKNS